LEDLAMHGEVVPKSKEELIEYPGSMEPLRACQS